MHHVLHDLLYTKCFVYIDDIIVFGKTESEVIERTFEVLNKLFDDGLKVGGLKCEFMLTSTEVLGHVISNGKLYAKVDKI